jgi:hypothetical protein
MLLFYKYTFYTVAMRKNAKELNAIRETLYHYDPDGRTVVVGTAALALQGIKVPFDVPDVDTLASLDHITDLREGMAYNALKNTTILDDTQMGDHGISLRPNHYHSAMVDILPYQSFTEASDERYDMDFYLAYARSVSVEDFRVLPVHEILYWKASISRPKDVAKVDQIISRRSIRDYLSTYQIDDLREMVRQGKHKLEAVEGGHVCDCYICPYEDEKPSHSSSYGYPVKKAYATTAFRPGAQF